MMNRFYHLCNRLSNVAENTKTARRRSRQAVSEKGRPSTHGAFRGEKEALFVLVLASRKMKLPQSVETVNLEILKPACVCKPVLFLSLNFSDRRKRPRFKFGGQFATAAAVSARTAPRVRTNINAVFSAITAHAHGQSGYS